jgi:hypothetical protein
MARIVVEQHEPPRADRPGIGNGALDTGVAPADPLLVLVPEVLRVVQEQVGVARNRPARDPVPRPLREVPGQRRLVVGEVRDDHPVGLDPEPDRGPGVHDESRGERGAFDRPRLLRHVVKRQLSRDLAQVDREERR